MTHTKYSGPIALKSKEYSPKDNQDFYIQEKIDGSQLTMAYVDDEWKFYCRGKTADDTSRCFIKAINLLRFNSHLFNKDYIYHGESLTDVRHNIAKYNRVPLYHYIIYDIQVASTGEWLWYDQLQDECNRIGYEAVPVLEVGSGPYVEISKGLIGKDSVLGGEAEGIVVKFRVRTQQAGSYKLVIKSFREGDVEDINRCDTDNYIKNLGLAFAKLARRHKAVQHLEEAGIECSNANIKIELDNDLEKEHKEAIKEVLWQQYQFEIKKYAREFPSEE